MQRARVAPGAAHARSRQGSSMLRGQSSSRRHTSSLRRCLKDHISVHVLTRRPSSTPFCGRSVALETEGRSHRPRHHGLHLVTSHRRHHRREKRGELGEERCLRRGAGPGQDFGSKGT